MPTEERFLNRIYIPTLVVAAVALFVIALTMNQTIDEEALDDPVSLSKVDSPDLTYSKETVALETAVSKLDAVLQQRIDSADKASDNPEIESERKETVNRIKALRKANEDNWEIALEAARDQLQEYADAVSSEMQSLQTKG